MYPLFWPHNLVIVKIYFKPELLIIIYLRPRSFFFFVTILDVFQCMRLFMEIIEICFLVGEFQIYIDLLVIHD
jgi:hypothetical protein